MRYFHRTDVLKVFFSCFALLIFIKALWIQVGNDPRLERLSNRQFKTKITVLPRRGLILDRSGEGLAITTKVHSLFIRPEFLNKETSKKNRARILANLSQILQVPQKELSAKFSSKKGFVWIKRQLNANEEQSIKDRGILEYGDGIGLAEETQRFYPNKELGAHVLGSVNVDGSGIEGLELAYNSILKGESVRIPSTKDAMGRRIYNDGSGILAVKDGHSLILTLDKNIQYEAEKALRRAVEEHHAKAGTAIVADVESGDILAMTNFPTFNPNSSKNSTQDQRRNRAITDTYEPGSTFKPFIVGMALEKGKSPKTKIYCEKGSFIVGGRKISEAEAREKYEWLTLSEILKFSSNVGSAKLSLLLGSSNVSQLFDKLGLSQRTNIDLPGEVSGNASRSELKSPIRLANVGFGHGITVTPIQMMSYYLALANGGKWIQPKLVKAIISEDEEALDKGALRWKIGDQKIISKSRQIFSGATTKWISQMLETVAEEGGTATKAQLEEWPVAGKTGTAQKIDPETRKYSRSRYIASFVGYAPANNPKLVTLVLIDEPKNQYYASETAAPAFQEIMRAALMKQGVPPVNAASNILKISNRSLLQSMKVEAAKTAQVSPLSPVDSIAMEDAANETSPLDPNNDSRFRMPNLRGLSVREALKALSAESLQIEVVGTGILESQTPQPNHMVSEGMKVKLFFTSKNEL